MDFGRRLRLFLFGLIIGSVLAWFFLGDRLTNTAWTPEARIKQRLTATLVKATPAAQAQLNAWPADLPTVRNAIPGSEVILSRTRRNGDSLFYSIDAEIGGRAAQLVVMVFEPYEIDSTATLLSLRSE
jgi:hypothetical protein